jgi:hypothetical protein
MLNTSAKLMPVSGFELSKLEWQIKDVKIIRFQSLLLRKHPRKVNLRSMAFIGEVI